MRQRNGESGPRLFVYGTLAPGRSNAHVLADLDGTWHPATIRGRLYPDGLGGGPRVSGRGSG